MFEGPFKTTVMLLPINYNIMYTTGTVYIIPIGTLLKIVAS